MKREAKSVRVGIAGFGTVGRAVANILVSHAEEVARRCGAGVRVSVVCRRGEMDAADIPEGAAAVHDWRAVTGSPDVDLVIETMGGTEAARALALEALERGKPLVTANKNLMAAHGEQLMRLAAGKNLPLGFEAAVAGGIPVIRAIAEGTAADRLRAVYGILNGTANFILTRMQSEGAEFGAALAEAQRLGYAEQNPAADVDGLDARDKLAILARLAFGVRVLPTSIPTSGIRGLEAIDMAYARQLRAAIRLVGAAERSEAGLTLSVRPWLVEERSLLGMVTGVNNAVFIEGERLGTQMFYGRGAGGDATAVAVLSDVMEIAADLAAGRASAKFAGGFLSGRELLLARVPAPARWYLRLRIQDRPGVLARIAGILGKHGINIDCTLQQPWEDKERLPFVITVEPVSEPDMMRAVAAIDASGAVLEPVLLLRKAVD
ncbi:MAG: homoserine dehydrogenase [Terriglobales bacterium]